MAILTGGCAFRVWDLVRHEMGWSGEVYLGCIIGGVAGKWCCIRTLGSGSNGVGLLGTIEVGWEGM